MELENVMSKIEQVDTSKFSFENLLIYIKNFAIDIYQYIYPFFIKYMLFLKDHWIIAWIIIFVWFHIVYFSYLEITKKEFSIFSYIFFFIFMPISILLYSVLLIDALIKRFVFYKLFKLEYPYVPYEIKLQLDAMKKEFELREKYRERFKT